MPDNDESTYLVYVARVVIDNYALTVTEGVTHKTILTDFMDNHLGEKFPLVWEAMEDSTIESHITMILKGNDKEGFREVYDMPVKLIKAPEISELLTSVRNHLKEIKDNFEHVYADGAPLPDVVRMEEAFDNVAHQFRFNIETGEFDG